VYPHLELYSTQASKTLAQSNIYPAFNICKLHKQPTFLRSCSPSALPDPAVTPLRTQTITQTLRKTDVELHPEVSQPLQKRPARNSKTHLQLHTEVFQDGVVWTPSGYVQDISSLITKRREDIPVRESQHRPSNSIPLPSRSRSRTITSPSSDKVVFPLGQLPALPPPRVCSPVRVISSESVLGWYH